MEHKRTVFQNVDEERLKQLLLTTPETKKRSSVEQEDDTIQKGIAVIASVMQRKHCLALRGGVS